MRRSDAPLRPPTYKVYLSTSCCIASVSGLRGDAWMMRSNGSEEFNEAVQHKEDLPFKGTKLSVDVCEQDPLLCAAGEEVTCNCCFCDVPVAEATAMECTHGE